jgi:hypothetical protein
MICARTGPAASSAASSNGLSLCERTRPDISYLGNSATYYQKYNNCQSHH